MTPITAADPAPASGLIRSWSTDSAPPAERLAYGVNAICEGFLEMSATSPAVHGFHSRLDSAACGPVCVNRVRGSTQDVYRTRAAIARTAGPHARRDAPPLLSVAGETPMSVRGHAHGTFRPFAARRRA